jgi:hypothetical protein
MGEIKNSYKILVGTGESKRSLGRFGTGGKIKLKLMLEKHRVRVWTRNNCVKIRMRGGLL